MTSNQRSKSQRKLIFASAAIAALAALATVGAAQQQPEPLKVTKIRDNVYVTQGGDGGNTGIIVGTSSVIVVDTKTTVNASKEVQAEIVKITSKPVKTAIVTHSDGDHANGLGGFPAGLTIIAQENCKKEMEASVGSRGGAPADRIPTKTVGKDETMTIDGVRVRFLHWAPGHTSGDLVIFLPDQKVAFLGDLMTYPNRPDVAARTGGTLIHAEKGGSVAGWLENAKGIVSLNADTYVTGHGELMTKEDTRQRLALIQGKWDKVKALAAQGKSLAEVKTALGESIPAAGAADQSVVTAAYNEIRKKG